MILWNILLIILYPLGIWRHSIWLFYVFWRRYLFFFNYFLLLIFFVLLKFWSLACLNLFDFVFRSFFKIISRCTWSYRTNLRWTFKNDLLIDIFGVLKCWLIMLPLIRSCVTLKSGLSVILNICVIIFYLNDILLLRSREFCIIKIWCVIHIEDLFIIFWPWIGLIINFL